MSLSSSWQFIGGVNGAFYRFFDWLRSGVNRRLVRYLSTHLPKDKTHNITVLESGSGPAFATALFAKEPFVHRAVCLDIDEAALRQAKRRDPRCCAVVGDMCNMPFRADSFAMVFSSSTVEHLDTPQNAVREMSRVCNDEGCVFVGVPYLFGPLMFQPLIHRTTVGEWLGPVFSRQRLGDLLTSAGLTPVASVRYFLRFFIGTVAAKHNAHLSNIAKVSP